MPIIFPKSALVFLFSPIFSIFFVLKDIYENKISGYILFALLFSILSYFYIPSINGDKSYYFNLYNYFSSISFLEGIVYIRTNMSDITLYYLILIFSHLGLSFSTLSGLMSGTGMGVLFFIFRKSVIEFNLSKFMILFLFITLICSLNLPSFLSGVRYYFAIPFIIYGFYLSLVENKSITGLICLLFASSIHFTGFIFTLATLIYILFKRNASLLKAAYLFSFLFLLIPPIAFVSNVVDFIPYIDIDLFYIEKYLAYVGEEFEVSNAGHAIYLFVGSLWYFLINLYALLNINRSNNKWTPILLISLIFANITFAFPDVLVRFGYVTTVIFIFVLIHDYKTYKYNYFFAVSYLIISLMTTSLDVLILRDTFKESYMKIGMLTLPSMILTDPIDNKEFDKGNICASAACPK